jgi:hypothetical protein
MKILMNMFKSSDQVLFFSQIAMMKGSMVSIINRCFVSKTALEEIEC